MSNLEKLGEIIVESYHENAADTLAVLLGSVVSMIENEMKLRGYDHTESVTIPGNLKQRKITIHKVGEE